MDDLELESSIPNYLQKERTKPSKLRANWMPPFPSYSARFPQSMEGIAMAIIGAQYRSKSHNDGAAMSKLSEFITSQVGDIQPSFAEQASVVDPNGAYNVAILAYWPSKQAYDRWNKQSGFEEWWQAIDCTNTSHGWFLEVFLPSMDGWETVFSNSEVPEGASHMRQGISGMIKEHGYWGSMRDRLPIAQVDDIEGEGPNGNGLPNGYSTRQRIHVPGRENLAIIRSGQDWSGTYPEERKLYLEAMHPVLTKGMDFLRDEGKEALNCYSCRFMDIVDSDTLKADKDRTFGLAYFDDLGSLEKWSKQHKTHLDIFGRFLKYTKELNNNITLRLFHEVLVLKPEQQYFEYIGCHEKTGMLTAL